jgi:hypothetical protein
MRAFAILAFLALASAGQAAAPARPGARAEALRAAAASRPFKPITFGRWVVDGLGDWVEASTDNGSGSEFGLLCGSECLIYLDFRTECDEGHDYPAMVNSGAGALSISMRCHHYEERPIFITEATEDYVDMLEQGEEVGFAFPLADGQFRVARFSTRGGTEAVAAAVRIAMKNGTLKEAPKDVSI